MVRIGSEKQLFDYLYDIYANQMDPVRKIAYGDTSTRLSNLEVNSLANILGSIDTSFPKWNAYNPDESDNSRDVAYVRMVV